MTKYKEMNQGYPLFIRYRNRKLYNVKTNSYMNACDVLRVFRNEPKTKVIQHGTHRDITQETILRAAIEDKITAAKLFNQLGGFHE